MYISIEKELNTYNNILRFDKFLIYYSVYKGWLYMVNIQIMRVYINDYNSANLILICINN